MRARPMSEGIARVREILARLGDRHLQPIETRRAGLENFLGSPTLPHGVEEEPVRLDGVPALRIRAPGATPDRALLLLHGGAFVAGSARSHRGLGAVLSEKARAVAFLPDYRRAPECPFPAALDDAVAAWRGVTSGDASQAALVGDSAGGGLALATAVAVRDEGLPAPRAIVCMSPWLDLTCDAASYETHAGRDPFLNPEGLRQDAASYLNGADPRDPRASPLFANLEGLAPLLVQVGSEEILVDDATRVVERALRTGGEATLEVWPEMIHVFQSFRRVLPEADEALDRVGTFLGDAFDGVPRAR